MSNKILDAAKQIRSQAIDRADDLKRAHWRATPEAWMEIRHSHDAVSLVRITGPTAQELLGIPLRIVRSGTSPAIDLIIE